MPGNHEYYNYCDVMDNGLQWNWMFKNNIGYYQNQVVRIDDTDFVLSTLWSQINPNDEYFVWNEYAVVTDKSERRIFCVERNE